MTEHKAKKPAPKQQAARAKPKQRAKAEQAKQDRRAAARKAKLEARLELRRQGKSPHWFGVPRWIVGAVVVGAIVFLAVYQPWSVPGSQVRGIVAALRGSALYTAPGAPPVLDAGRVRQIVGDRPIVVVAMPDTPLPPGKTDTGDDDAELAFCQQIADQVTNDYVLLLSTSHKADGGHDRYEPADCYGPDFPVPDKMPGTDTDSHDDEMFTFDFALSQQASAAAQFQDTATDLTPAIEQFTLAYDDLVREGYTTPPQRGAIPDRLAGNDIVLDAVAMIAGVVAVFALLRLAARSLGARQLRDAELRRRHTALGLRLNQIAGTVLHPRPALTAEEAATQADVAQRYLALLTDAEAARTPDALTAAEHEADALVTAARA